MVASKPKLPSEQAAQQRTLSVSLLPLPFFLFPRAESLQTPIASGCGACHLPKSSAAKKHKSANIDYWPNTCGNAWSAGMKEKCRVFMQAAINLKRKL